MSGRFRLAWLLALVLAAAGCAPQVLPPPASPPEYRDMEASWRISYPRRTILLYNLQRVLDVDLNARARADSLKIVAELSGDENLVLEQLAGVLADGRTPQGLRDEVLTFLLRKDYPELAPYVVKVLPQVRGSERMRSALLEWLVRHPTAAALSEVVKAWADVGPSSPTTESDFRLVIERLTGRSWYDALLEAMNAPGFTARGSAIEVLSQRAVAATLKRDIMNLPARTEAVIVLQAFVRRFDALPATGQELLSMAHIHRMRSGLLASAAELHVKWRRFDGYRFNVRDFHLLSRLAADPKSSSMTRAELVSDLTRTLMRRRHVRLHMLTEREEDISARFDRLADRLTMADLWNLCFLNDMLSRPNIQAAVAVMADEDRGDRRQALGGLVFLEFGRAQAKLYPAGPLASTDDLTYVPSSRAVSDGRDALCRFQGHFETLDNAARAGPTAREVFDARKDNYYLLVLTSLDEGAFCAHYVNPSGVMVSLGQFPLAR